jgi:hypothetical protein
LNWKRVAVFVGLLYCATLAAAFPFGFMVGIYIARGHPVPDWIPVGQPLALLCAGTAVFFCLARYQSERVWRHAVAVLLIGWLLAFGINVVVLGVRVRAWAMSLPLFAVPLVIGVSLGRLWRHHTDTADGPTPPRLTWLWHAAERLREVLGRKAR